MPPFKNLFVTLYVSLTYNKIGLKKLTFLNKTPQDTHPAYSAVLPPTRVFQWANSKSADSNKAVKNGSQSSCIFLNLII